MTRWQMALDSQSCSITTDGYTALVPLGWAQLGHEVLRSDPPRPDELTNAIGAVADHLDDVVRERPDAIGADWHLVGRHAEVIAAVELGHAAILPMQLHRSAVEDVFRTLATESAGERRHNPGLPAELVPTIVAACCIAVGIMRRLHLDLVTVAAIDQDAAS